MTLNQAEQLLESSRGSHNHRSLVTLGLLTSLVLLGLWTLTRGPGAVSPWLAVATPWCIVFLLFGRKWVAVVGQRRVARDLTRAMEAAELNDWPRVSAGVTRLLGRPIQSDNARVQALLLLASATERARQHEVSEFLLEAVLHERSGSDLQQHQAVVGLAMVKLRSEQLTDAVQMLERLRRVELPGQLRAGLELTRLFQEVLMGHHDIAAASIDERRPLFRRHLSTRAGYGYALYAAAMHGLGRKDDAGRFWQDATLLLPAEQLIRRYELLAPIARTYPACECPL